MRQIKFRAWDKDKKKMLFPDGKRWGFKLSSSFLGAGMNRILIISPDGDLVKYEKVDNDIRPETEVVNEEYELMQFTDLLDRNGKEIYEGDINADDVNKKSVVEFYAGGFYLKSSPTEYLHIGATAPFDRNVIGNIYENPELLK